VSKTGKIANNLILHFQMIKLCCEVFLINNFQRQSCSCIWLENVCTCLKKQLSFDYDPFYAFYKDFRAYLDQWKLAIFQTAACLHLINDCIDLHVRDIVKKGLPYITRSKSIDELVSLTKAMGLVYPLRQLCLLCSHRVLNSLNLRSFYHKPVHA